MTELMPTFKINVDEAQVPAYTLPDPLLMASGEPVLEAAAWREGRRAEILALFETHVYGKTPAAPLEVGATVTACDPAALFEPSALSGGAMRKEVRLHFPTEHGNSWMDLLVYLPAQANGPVPVFVGLNFWGNHSIHLDPAIRLSSQWMPDDAQRGFENNRAAPRSRGQSAHRWPVETIWGAIVAWAWGLSRALDCFREDDQIDHRRVAVLGHSRQGRAVLWAGAQDERFALVISNNSGCGGAALSRRQFGETVEAINARFPHWFCANVKQFGDDVGRLPVDQHLLLAPIAPRPLYVASAEQDLWADPHGEFLDARAAGAVYRFLGSDGLAAETMPPVGQPVSGTIGYHIRPGEHDLTEYDWLRFLDFADRHLRSEPGKESVG